MTHTLPRMHVYGWNQGTGGTFWYRISEPLRGLTLRGHQTSTGSVMDDRILATHDTIVTHTLHDERGSEAWLKICDRGQHRTIIDIDDDVWNFHPSTDAFDYWTRERLHRLQNNIASASLVTTPNPRLANILRHLNANVAVLGNYVPEWLLSHNPRRILGKFVIGYQGARQHMVDLRTIADDIGIFLYRHQKARLNLYGELNPIGWPEGRVIRTPWNSDIPEYYRSLQMTIGIGPLADVPFNHMKSAIRAVEYAALGFPSILTDVDIYREYVIPDVTGWLIGPGEPWLPRLEYAFKRPELLTTMGKQARRRAHAWTTEANAHRWEDAYRGR